MVFVPGFITEIWEIAGKQHIATTEQNQTIFFCESPYISTVQVIDFLYCSDEKSNTDRHALEFLFCLTK